MGCACSKEEDAAPVRVEVRPSLHGRSGGGGGAKGPDAGVGGGGTGPPQQQQHQQPQHFDPTRSVLKRWEDVRDHYAFDKVLGRGQFGVTRLVASRATGERAACKSISKRKLVNPEDLEDVRREIKVMHHLSGHPNVVSFRGAFEDAQHVHIVMELCTGGELFEHIVAKGHYRERDAAHLMRSLVAVVAHCHQMDVVHRDLKPENFLFREAGRRHLVAIDFGLSTFYQEGQVLSDLVGSPFYMAPEVLKRSYGKAADIWSCGVIMYILLCGSPPFYGNGTQQIFRAVLHDSLDLASPPWDSVSAPAKDCVRRMLTRDPRRRATAAEVLAHPWMREGGGAGGGAGGGSGGGGAGGGGGSAAAAGDVLQPEILRRMRNFAALNRLKKEALRVVASALPPEEIEGVRRMFSEMDGDGSGSITFDELREGLRRKGAHIADAELERLMAGVDLDGSNALDFEEFLAATVFLGKLERRELLLNAFAHFDSDGSGFITEAEVRAALKGRGLAEAQLQELLGGADRDDDGRIDYDEFCRMLQPAIDSAAAYGDGRRRASKRGGRRGGGGGGGGGGGSGGGGGGGGDDGEGGGPRHTLLTARSGGWQAARALAHADEEEEEEE